jgi:HEAT repeat protein
MRDLFYHHLIQQCQSADLGRRIQALEDLRQHEYLDLVEAQFLLDRLNSTSNSKEQSAILELMGQIAAPLPTQALMAILEDRQTSSLHLRIEVAQILAHVQAEEAFDLLLRLLLDEDEDVCLREILLWDLATWGTHISDELLVSLIANPELCDSALSAWCSRPPDAIPLEVVLPYCTHEKGYLRRAAIKTLLAAGPRAPIEPILAALRDPEIDVRTAASHGCLLLAEWCGDKLPLEPLLEALHDDYPPVREDMLYTLGQMPLRIPVEPVIAALTDPIYYVRCAAIEAFGSMGERVPTSVYSTLREMLDTDPSAHVRQGVTRTLLRLSGMQPAPPRFVVFDPTLSDLDE